MGLRFPGQVHGQCFFVTTSCSGRERLIAEYDLYQAVVNSLQFYRQRERAAILGYVLMPNHMHLLLVISGARLGHFMRDFKKYVSQRDAYEAGVPYTKLWQFRYDRQVITTLPVLRTKLSYIHLNPVRAGLVRNAEDWKWSSARDYLTAGNGPLQICRDWF